MEQAPKQDGCMWHITDSRLRLDMTPTDCLEFESSLE